MAGRYELYNTEFNFIKDLLPNGTPKGGRPWVRHEKVLNGIFWVLCSGSTWRDLPERYGPWQTAYDRFRRWEKDGTFFRILERLQIKLLEDGTIDLETWFADSTAVKANPVASGARKSTKKKL